MKILLVEDDLDSRHSIRDFLQELEHEITECSNGSEAIKAFDEEDYDLVLTDIKMPKVSGIELLNHLSQYRDQKEFEVILFTGHGDMESAIEALRAGAKDYLLKPIEIQELAEIIERLEETRATRELDKALAESIVETKLLGEECSKDCIEGIMTKISGIGEIGVFSEASRESFQQALKLHADRDIPVLIEGETGTGKEVIARLIHFGGNNNDDKPFVDINCAAMSPSLFESELFGYEAGAYTGALVKGSKGKLDLASGGTLFLDEIGEMSLEMQAKLLRVIQEKRYYRVGGLQKITTDVRIVCATNLELEKRVQAGLFRADLYFRLNVGRITLSSLKNRKEEILYLALMFLRRFSRKKGKKFKGIEESAAKILEAYDWPGNIRELRNLIEWVVFKFDCTTIKPKHLELINNDCQLLDLANQDENKLGFKREDLPENGLPLEDYIDDIVLQALKLNLGNKKRTAEYLGISRRSLYTRLNKILNKA